MTTEYDSGAFPPFAVTTDIALFTITDGHLMVTLIERGESPYKGAFALPGGFVHESEDLEDAARRELVEETGLKAALTYIEQFRVYGEPHRDPRMRVVTVAYWAIVPFLHDPIGGGDAASARMIPISTVLDGGVALAFDHNQILIDALGHARRALETTTVATRFCPAEFTIAELRNVYEAVWDTRLDAGNFQKKVTEIRDFVIPTGRLRHGGSGRPPETYVAGSAQVIEPPLRRPVKSEIAHRWADAPSLASRQLVVPMMRELRRESSPPSYPMLDRELFDDLPKARKSNDVKRILHSPQSEDWVTWNVSRLLLRRPADDWWPRVLDVVRESTGSDLQVPAPSEFVLWRSVRSPASYEATSRQRMLESENQAWLARAQSPKPVEGASEIDVSMTGDDYLIFAEAKLGSDVSLRTTYDPYRNQLLRNIDCVVEYSHGRQPFFWMLAKDRSHERLYIQLLDKYRNNPSMLAHELPHRSESDFETLAGHLAIVTWAALLDVITPHDAEERAVYAELSRRAG